MGCDIHFYVEHKFEGRWETADTWKTEEYEGEPTYRSVPKPFYNGRNYDLFAILADVRNGHGFAGIKTGNGFVPIDQPRGFTSDVSANVRAASDRYGCDGHSHSWFTLAELLNADWTQTTHKQGWANLKNWAEWWKARGTGPREYCGGVSGQDVKHITPDEMELLVKQRNAAPWKDREAFQKQRAYTYALAEWETTYAQAAGDEWWCRTIPALLGLAGGIGNADKVRIVFFFDN
jgi:hypothetical protein